ncbi:MAG: glycoside hydrolase family 2 TIM barrel-domain containing protein [Nevskiales bacterium]|nr:glycoside hydrolase family 2 TIM barrel-domain containing protein [Nevskiales bacterium]
MTTRWDEAPPEETPFHKPADERPEAGLAPLLGSALCRPATALHGDWRIIIDQSNLGETNPMMYGGVGRGEADGPDELLEYSFDGNDTLSVPGDWNTQRPELFWYRGVVWYRRDFDWRRPSGRRVYLYFGGANFRKSVYLNGRLLARHAGGFTPFNIDVTDYLVDGNNRLIVKVDSRSGADEIPTEFNDWLNYGGITREVLLIELPPTFVEHAVVQLRPGSRDTLRVRVRLAGVRAAGAPVRLEIPEAGVSQDLLTDADGLAQGELCATLEPWSPQAPKRYRVEIIAGEDRLADDIGFRSIEVAGDQILLNGKPVFLRGISMHEERLAAPGRAWGPEDAAAAVDAIRALGANFVRLAHYPHNEYMVRACDAAGILVWAELPVYHAVDFGSADALASAQRQYAEMIARDVNRAAVVFWSIANETEPGPARDAFLGALARQVRALDDSRLLTAALHGNRGMRRVGEHLAMQIVGMIPADAPPPPVQIDDPLAEQLDVVGYNQYFGWYTCGPIARELRRRGIPIREADVRERMLAAMPGFRYQAACGKPIVISEFGAEAVKGLRGEGTRVFSEDYQVRVYEKQLEMLSASPAIRGLSPWILKDFRTPYRLHTKWQQYWNRKGLLSEHGERKLAFDVLASHYRALRDGDD